MTTKEEIINRICRELNDCLEPQEFISVSPAKLFGNYKINFGDFDSLYYDTEDDAISALQGVRHGMFLKAHEPNYAR